MHVEARNETWQFSVTPHKYQLFTGVYIRRQQDAEHMGPHAHSRLQLRCIGITFLLLVYTEWF